MKNLKKLSVIASVVGVIGLGSFAYAANSTTPTGIESEIKSQMLEQKIAIINERVKEGKITQEQADQIINEIKENQASCDVIGSRKIGKKYGLGFGKGNGQGRGMGRGCNINR